MRIFPTLSLSVLAALVLTVAAPGHAQAADLELDISGVVATSGPQGYVMVAAFADPAMWLRKPVAAQRVLASTAKDGRVTVRLTGLPDGPVAVSIFQDINGNGTLDTNPVGMPLEPFAFSRQAQGNFGPPKFEQAVLDAGTTRHAIQLPAAL